MRLLRILLALPFVIAASDVPVVVPVPAEKPASEPGKQPQAEAEAPDADEQPPKKKEEDEPDPAPPPDPPPPKPDEAALAACELELEALGVDFERTEAVDGAGSCGLPATYRVEEILRGVSLAPDTRMRCATALATAEWVREVVVPAAKVLGEDVRLTGIRHASTYVCRNRNGKAGAKISQHALGNAIDIRTFEFDGHPPLSIEPRSRTGSVEEGFQKAVQAGACLHFTTVLGPGSDAYHDDHLHLDLARRSRGFRLCQ